MPKKINVKLGDRSYAIHIGEDLLGRCGDLVRASTRAKRGLVLSTPDIFKAHGRGLRTSLKKAGLRALPFFVPDGERHKNEKTLFQVLKRMAENGLRRDSCLISLGGGVVGDLGGLAASLYMRGIDFIQCPTTLLAQVDASVGGKTAIDFSGIKNLVGAFHQPRLVLIDPRVLKTLDERQYRTGLAEVVKYGVIQDAPLFRKMEDRLSDISRRDPRILTWLIERSCRIKAGIVSADEREEGKRAWLNYGHTLGHALESYFRYNTLTHGEAIAFGMRFASLLSRRLGLCGEEIVRRQFSLLRGIGLLGRLPRFDTREVFRKMTLDKKARSGGIQFVLTRKIGLVTIQKNVAKSLLMSVLDHLQKETRTAFSPD